MTDTETEHADHEADDERAPSVTSFASGTPDRPYDAMDERDSRSPTGRCRCVGGAWSPRR
jgi:hypothetical protein